MPVSPSIPMSSANPQVKKSAAFDRSDIERVFQAYDFDRVVSPAVEPRAYILGEVERLGLLFDDVLTGDGTAASLGSQLETLCAQLEYLGLRRRDAGLASYADIAPQAGIFHCLIELFRVHGSLPVATDLADLLTIWSEALSESRLYLYLQATVQLERGYPEAALKNVRAALNLNNVCIGSQHLLERIAREHPGLEHLPAHLSDAAEYLKDRFCAMPFTFLSTGWQGDAFVCSCPAWLPYKVGNIATAASEEALWNSSEAKEIRASILDGSFRYCSRTLCEYINSRKLPLRAEITEPGLAAQIRENNPVATAPARVVELNHDNSCNLACPSCRPEIRMAKPAEFDRYNQAIPRTILPLLKNVSDYVYISGGGEAFASRHYRELLAQLNKEDFPNLKIFLITNALLLNPRMWEKFQNLNGMFLRVAASIDAATKVTYERVRRPGKWEDLLVGMDFLAAMRAGGQIPDLGMNFVVQQENFRELPEFIAWGNHWGADNFWLQRMANYGSFTAAEFQSKDVCRPDHPDHEEFLEVLRDPLFQDPRIHAGMLQSCIPGTLLPRYDGHAAYVTGDKSDVSDFLAEPMILPQ